MKVKTLNLLNFRGIHELSMNFTQRTTAFVGINGVGKSTILDALAIALSQLIWRLNGNPQKARPIAVDDIKIGEDFARIEVTIELKGKPVKWALVTNRRKGLYTDPLRKSDLDELNATTRELSVSSEGIDDVLQERSSLPLSVFYDVNRAVLDVPMRVREKLSHNPYEIYQDALDHGGADFKRFFIWFRNFEDLENEMRIDSADFRVGGLEAARNAISIFTGFSGLRVRRKPKMRMTVTKGGGEFNVLQLSDGERNMLALVGDLARRLSVLNSGLANPNEGAGVVLIDEVDLHLHPAWQRTVVSKLESTFPNCQFIVSTHSPQIIGELAPESVFLLRDGRFIGHAPRSIGLSSAEVLVELMDGRARNIGFEERVQRIEKIIESEDYKEAKSELNSLESEYGVLPEILRLQEYLEWFHPTEKMDVEAAWTGGME